MVTLNPKISMTIGRIAIFTSTSLLISFLVLVIFTVPAFAATYYMGGVGDHFQNLQAAFTGPNKMSGGDTLIIRDGTYEGSTNKIWQFMFPPSGRENAYTIIQAEHPGKVVFQNGAGISTGNYANNDPNNPICYVQFKGFKFIGGCGLYGMHHIKFFQCAFEGNVSDGNSTAFSMNTCHYMLLEDCIAYGKGRYKLLVYLSSEVVLRRCIARQDYANGNWDPASGTEPIAIFSIYTSSNVACQNCISIDGDQPRFWQNPPTEFGGSFYAPRGSRNTLWTGCISLNVAMEGSYDTDTNINGIFNQCVFWHEVSGVGSKGSSGSLVRHSTIGDLRTVTEMGLTALQTSRLDLSPGKGVSGLPAENNIITGVYLKAICSTSLGGNMLFNNANNGNVIPGDFMDIDPFSNSLKYLPRIETNSDLSGKATDGGDIGATILKRIGRSGTLYGDPGYDEVTDENLWPWPYEDWIKENMGNYNRGGTDTNLPRGDRGFAAYVSPHGSPNTLTSYIWEYLGNKIPGEIYGTAPGPAVAYGDVSGDGQVSMYDAALAAQHAIGLITLTSEQLQRADVSGDGKISMYDAALIAQRALGLISRFPVEG